MAKTAYLDQYEVEQEYMDALCAALIEAHSTLAHR